MWLPTPRFAIGLGLILLGAGALLVAAADGDDVERETLGPNLPVNEGAADPADFSSHNSPSVAQDPTQPDALAIVNRIDTPDFSCALHLSFDGGRSWRQSPIPAPAGRGSAELCFSPDVAYGPDGTLYVSFVTLQGRGNVPAAGWLIRSSDGGRTLSGATRVLEPLSFQVRLVADPERQGRVYVTWVQAREVGLFSMGRDGNPVQFIRSDDSGRTWSEPVRIDDGRRRPLAPSLAVASDGSLVALYLDLGDDSLDYLGAHEGEGGDPYDGAWQLVSARSSDDGATWEESVVEEELVPSERFIVFIPPSPSLAAGPGDRVYATYQDGDGGDADVKLWASDDSGKSWASPVVVNDDGDGTTQSRPRVAVAPDGRVDVLYYDRRADPDDEQTEVSLQSSSDHGAGFGEQLVLSDRPFSSKVGFGSERELPDLGSRLALLSGDSRALAVWSDTRAGTPASGKQDLSSSVVGFAEAEGLSGTAQALLRLAGIAAIVVGLALLVPFVRRSQRPSQKAE